MMGKCLVTIAALSLLAASAAATGSILADIAPLGAQENELADTDFVVDLSGSTPVATGDGGEQRNADVKNLKALRLSNGAFGGGGNQILFEFEPCGFRTPHHHPRGTENFFILEGKVAANIIREGGGALISNQITKGYSGFFPQAHFHFLQNIGCEPASAIVMFDNNDPGVINTAASLNLPFDTIQGALGNFDLVANAEIIADTMQQSKACLKRCGLVDKEPKVYTADYPATTAYAKPTAYKATTAYPVTTAYGKPTTYAATAAYPVTTAYEAEYKPVTPKK
jgi:oxalate decarboxylase/phosphoglucose isomerase-like protein (cupin superfamily)